LLLPSFDAIIVAQKREDYGEPDMASTDRDTVIEGLLRRLARMQQLLIVSRILTETVELDTLLRYIMETATDLTGTEASSILLFDAEANRLQFVASTGIKSSELHDLPVPLESSIAGAVWTSGKPLAISDVRKSPDFYDGIDARIRFHTRSILGVPLEVKRRKIGVLEVVNKREDLLFTEDDVEVMAILGAQAAVSIENARLFGQSDLVSDVVHELRTPLTSVIGYSKMLLMHDSLPSDTVRQFASTIHREATRLGDMVNGYLDLARLESGRSKLKLEELDLEPIIADIIQLMQPQAEERNIRLEAKYEGPANAVLADRERFRQVLLNLLSNAIKYNLDGGNVMVVLSRTQGATIVSVQDSGVGIDETTLSQVFDKFYRAETEEGQPKGTGLGLSIVKQIVEMHGGSIEVTSALGKGSTFSVQLPAGRRPTQTALSARLQTP
jgi:signal transduction histidine kinase